MKRYLFFIILIGLVAGGWWSVRRDATPVSDSQQPEQKSALGELLTSVAPSIFPAPSPTAELPALPSQKILSGGTQVFQTFNNCGPAALSMVLSHYGITVGQAQLGRELRPYQHPTGDNDDKSVTLDEVANKAREYGFAVYHRSAGNMEIIKQFIAHDMPVLARTWLTPGEDIGHFRVVKGYDETAGVVIQDDSLQGANLRYSYANFEELWGPFNFEFVVLVPAEKVAVAEVILGELVDEQTAWQKSLALAEQAAAENPADTYAIFNQAVARYHLGDYAGAIRAYESVESRLPFRMLWYQIEPVLAYYRVGNYDRVVELSDRILNRQNRAYSELYYLKGLVAQRRGDTAGAQAFFTQAEFYNTTSSWRANVEGLE